MSKTTIIIPFYNHHRHLDRCLAPLKQLDPEAFELIVVDDASAPPLEPIDGIRIIRHERNQGPSAARNTGLSASAYDVCLFIDSDVVVKTSDVELVTERFKRDQHATAFTCGYQDNPHHHSASFFTRYKNKYMSMVMSVKQEPTTFIYGAFCAVKKHHLLQWWPEHLRYGEDTFLATLLVNTNKTIVHYRDIKLEHLKTYSAHSLLANDFLIPFFFAKSFMARTDKARFSHVRRDQLLAIACTPFIPLTFPLWFYANRHLWQKMRSLPPIPVVLFTFLDQVVMGMGIATGLLYFGLTYRSEDTHTPQDLSCYSRKS